MIKIGVIGSITKDKVVIEKKNDVFLQVGGTVYYSAMTLANLGFSVVVIPLLAEGDAYLLKQLNYKNIAYYPAWTDRTTFYENRYHLHDFNICKRTLIERASGFSPTKEIFNSLSLCRALHLGPLSSTEFSQSTFVELRKNFKGVIGLDAQGFLQGSRENFLSQIRDTLDIIKFSYTELLELTHENTEEKAVEELRELGLQEIVVTRGSQGSSIYDRDQRYDIKASQAEKIIDATGCGDTYFAAYLLKRAQGYTPDESGKYASRIAAEKLAYRGPIQRNPT